MVAPWPGGNIPCVNLRTRHVLPTPALPTSTTLNKNLQSSMTVQLAVRISTVVQCHFNCFLLIVSKILLVNVFFISCVPDSCQFSNILKKMTFGWLQYNLIVFLVLLECILIVFFQFCVARLAVLISDGILSCKGVWYFLLV